MSADEKNALWVRTILDENCTSSGQMVSEEKCSIFVSPNTDVHSRVQVCKSLNMMTESLNDKCLGFCLQWWEWTIYWWSLCKSCKSLCNDSRVQFRLFPHLIDGVCARVAGWKEKCYQQEESNCCFRVVDQPIRVLAMSVFKIPNKRRFVALVPWDLSTMIFQTPWWTNRFMGEVPTQSITGYWCPKSIHWVAWWKLCIPKLMAAMGFRDLEYFNLAMLDKQWWGLMEEPNSLCVSALSSNIPGKEICLMQKQRRVNQWRDKYYGRIGSL